MARLCGSDCRGCYERLLGELEYRYAISILIVVLCVGIEMS